MTPNLPEKQSLLKQFFDLREQWELAIKIAWRNLFKHKGKSIIIGLILFVGAFLMTAGNAVLAGMNQGLEQNIVQRFTGDIVLIATNQKFESVIAGGGMGAVKPFSSYTNVKRIMLEQKSVEGLLPACRGIALVLNEQGEPGFTGIIGVELDKYQTFFMSNITAIEGKIPAPNERGALVAAGGRKANYQQSAIWFIPENEELNVSNLLPEILSNREGLNVQSNVVLLGMSEGNSSTDIRSPIKAVFRYKTLDSFWKDYSLMDLDSFRECFSWKSGDDEAMVIPEDKKKMLSMEEENLDALFSSDGFYEDSGPGKNVDLKALVKKKEKTSMEKADPELGTYNLVFVKLKKGYDLEKETASINAALKKENATVRAITWRKANASIGDLANLIQWFLIIVEGFIYLVAIVIIMNTLSMAALERTNEIGMMRAVGAGKGFIGQMFFSEIILLSGVFGGLGLGFGTALSWGLASLKLKGPDDNEFISLLFGGDYFHPVMDIWGILLVLGLQVLVTFVAMIYPLIVARKITPLEAISRD